MRQNQKGFPRHTLWPVVVIFSVCITLSLLAFRIIDNSEYENIEEKFRLTINRRIEFLRNDLHMNLMVLQKLQIAFLSADSLNRREFTAVSGKLIEKFPQIQALQWVPRVPAEEREAYRRRAVEDGLEDFVLTEEGPGGQLVKRRVAEEYYPVYYIEPPEGKRRALGFDLASNDTRRRVLEQARDTGEILATSRLTLTRNSVEEKGVLLFAPVYEGRPITIEERRESLRGFLVAVLSLPELIQNSLLSDRSGGIGINMAIYDIIGDTGRELLHIHKSRLGGEAFPDMYHYQKIEFMGRTWFIEGQPTRQFVVNNSTFLPFSVLMVGVLFTMAITFFAYEKNRTLRITEKTNRAIIEGATSGIVMIDRSGRIELFNNAAERIFGYEAGEVMGKNIKMLVPEPHRSRHDEYLKKDLSAWVKQQKGSSIEVEGLDKDGGRVPLELAVSEIRESGRRKFVGILTDITERKQSEWELIRSKQEAEEANRMKSEFLNVMSHELRTPLTVILGNLPLLTDPGDMPEAEEVVEIAEDMEANGQHLLVLINDLLDISKIDAGRMSLRLESMSARGEISVAIESMTRLAEARGLELVAEVEDLYVKADPIRFRQILTNLIGNAIKFTRNGGVCVSAATIEEGEEGALFCVRDTGMGIEEENLEYIFEMFRQVDSSSTRKVHGSGLGLAITKRLVELQKGKIWVESAPNAGSAFFFTLPLCLESMDEDTDS